MYVCIYVYMYVCMCMYMYIYICIARRVFIIKLGFDCYTMTK